MKKKVSMLAIAFVLYLGTCGSFITKTTYAQCGASCAMVCGNRCEAVCYDCSFWNCLDVAIQCCNEAHAGTGDTGPCGVQGAN